MTSAAPERSLAEWQALDHSHLHPFTDHGALQRKGTRVIARAEGVYLYDAEGRQLLDGMAGLWCVNLGYGRVELADAAYRQMRVLPYYNSFSSAPTRRPSSSRRRL
jgi:putrescine---pyruvate transaminase